MVGPTRPLAAPFFLLLVGLGVAAAGLDYKSLPGRAWLHQLLIWGVVLPAGAGFALGLRRLSALPDTPAARRLVALGAVPLALLAFSAPPFDSQDLIAYLNCGRIETHYGLNPYTTPLNRVPGYETDGVLLDLWPGTPCAYGFLFARLSAAVACTADADRRLADRLFKAVNLLALAAAAWLVDRGCRRAGTPRAAGVFLVAWNPLVLLHGVTNGHNDLLAGAGLVAALVAAHGRAWWAVLPALVAAGLVKYSTVPLLPLAGLFLVHQHGVARTLLSALLAAALAAWAAWPYVADGAALEASRNLANVTTFRNSLGSVVVQPLVSLGKAAPDLAPLAAAVATGLKALGGLLVVGLVGVLLWRRRREYPPAAFARDAVLVQFVLIVLASPKLFGWYLLMFLPAAGLLPAGRLRATAVAVGLAQLATFTFVGRADILSPLALVALPLWLSRRASRAAG